MWCVLELSSDDLKSISWNVHLQVLLSNAIFLGIVALIPFTLGRVILSFFSKMVMVTGSAHALSTLSMAAVSVFNINGSLPVLGLDQRPTSVLTGNIIASNNSFFNNFLSRVELPEGVSAGEVLGVSAAIESITEAMVSPLKLSDAATVFVGYVAIFVALSFYLGLIALLRYSRGEPITVGRIHGVASMAEAAPSVARQFMAGVRYTATMVKVAFLLVIELGVFPLLCGWWLDVCTLGMLEVTLAQRVTFFWSSPLTSCFLHWIVGIVYMLQISIFVSLLREVYDSGPFLFSFMFSSSNMHL